MNIENLNKAIETVLATPMSLTAEQDAALNEVIHCAAIVSGRNVSPADAPAPTKFPCDVWAFSKNSPYPHKYTITGETSRSWLCGEWRPVKLSKKEYRFLTEEAAKKINWTHEHRYAISKCVDSRSLACEMIELIADMVGYVAPVEKRPKFQNL